MLKRNIKITFRLNEEEHLFFTNKVKKTGNSQEAFIRALIRGYNPRELPPFDYHAMIRELHAIGSNLNQIAARANATGHIDSVTFLCEVSGGRCWTVRRRLPGRKEEQGSEGNNYLLYGEINNHSTEDISDLPEALKIEWTTVNHFGLQTTLINRDDIYHDGAFYAAGKHSVVWGFVRTKGVGKMSESLCLAFAYRAPATTDF